MPESALGGARYLIDNFITQLYDPHECRNASREGGCSKRGWQENMESGMLNNAGPKKKPRKTEEEIRLSTLGYNDLHLHISWMLMCYTSLSYISRSRYLLLSL